MSIGFFYLFLVLVLCSGSVGSISSVDQVHDQVRLPFYIISIICSVLFYTVYTYRNLTEAELDVGDENENEDDLTEESFELRLFDNDNEFDFCPVKMSQIKVKEDDKQPELFKELPSSDAKRELQRFFSALKDYLETLEAKKLIVPEEPVKRKKTVEPFRHTSRGLKRRYINRVGI
jgi:hypothetical protein